jgi:hypothetical protein
MNNNKNSSDLKNPESSNEITILSNEEQNPSHKAQNISEEKKNEIREKNKLRMQKKRASLSEEQKEQLKEKERIKRQQQRANLSNEEQSIRREKGAEQRRIKRQQQRANLSNEEQSIRREKDAEQHRNKYQEQKSFILQNHHLSNNKLFLNNRQPKIHENGDDEDIIEDEVEDKNEDGEDNSDFAVADHVKDWKAYREKRYAKSRIYKKARYAQLKDAEVKLLKAAENSTSDSDIQKLQQLATRRQQILAYGREYGRTYRQNHNRRQWVPIQQVWDEDNPCRYNIINVFLSIIQNK